MGIALFAASALAHPLMALHRWWNRQRPPLPQRGGAPAESPARATLTPRLPHTTGVQPRATTGPCPGGPRPARASELAGRSTARPACTAFAPVGAIRVLRSQGRMVIAGRMADVCAELERLAACEPQH